MIYLLQFISGEGIIIMNNSVKAITKKSITAWLLVTVMMVAFFPVDVFATHGFSSQSFRISVDGSCFQVWGYISGEIALEPSIRLRDIAYILSGTSAQFDVIATPDDSWDFWIKRGELYTLTSTEMQPISQRRRALFGSYGFLPGSNSPGFGQTPFQNIVIGFDGEDYPAFSISVTSVRDIDDIYFSLYDLSYWLGFNMEWEWEWETGYQVNISTIPPTTPTPGHHIRLDTFSVGSQQLIDYAYILRVRTGPGNHYDTLAFVNRGDEFEILDYCGRFVQIETAHGYGWIFAGFLSRRRTAVEPVFLQSAQPGGIVGLWAFVKFTESNQLNGVETELPSASVDWLNPTFNVFPDKSFRVAVYGATEGDLIQIAQNEFSMVNRTTFSLGEVWHPDDDVWLRYFPETGLLRYSFYNQFSNRYIHYYFIRVRVCVAV